ncbi:hypothetical protein RB195_020839 [Necator americanus]|uniref:Atg6 BARA domain-containing protein n=1 Tax=Necator americanus TaxID=51031 RepID=A0ABR1CKS7_NECAM
MNMADIRLSDGILGSYYASWKVFSTALLDWNFVRRVLREIFEHNHETRLCNSTENTKHQEQAAMFP